MVTNYYLTLENPYIILLQCDNLKRLSFPKDHDQLYFNWGKGHKGAGIPTTFHTQLA